MIHKLNVRCNVTDLSTKVESFTVRHLYVCRQISNAAAEVVLDQHLPRISFNIWQCRYLQIAKL